MNRLNQRAAALLMLLAGLVASPLQADERPHRRESAQDLEFDQDEALARLRGSEFKPLSEVIAAGQKVVAGEIVRVRVKRVRGRFVYELKFISTRGNIREVYVDAMTLDIVKVE